jgi:hypothetical protein
MGYDEMGEYGLGDVVSCRQNVCLRIDSHADLQAFIDEY